MRMVMRLLTGLLLAGLIAGVPAWAQDEPQVVSETDYQQYNGLSSGLGFKTEDENFALRMSVGNRFQRSTNA